MGQSETVHHLDFIIGLFAMMDPLAAIPMLLAVTAGFTGTQRRLTVLMALVGMLVILLGAQYSGVLLLETLGTSLASFQIAGGLVIAWSGFSMLRAVQEEPDRPTDVRRASPFELGIVPLAIPLLAGPGAITKVLLEAQDGFGLDAKLDGRLCVRHCRRPDVAAFPVKKDRSHARKDGNKPFQG